MRGSSKISERELKSPFKSVILRRLIVPSVEDKSERREEAETTESEIIRERSEKPNKASFKDKSKRSSKDPRNSVTFERSTVSPEEISKKFSRSTEDKTESDRRTVEL